MADIEVLRQDLALLVAYVRCGVRIGELMETQPPGWAREVAQLQLQLQQHAEGIFGVLERYPPAGS